MFLRTSWPQRVRRKLESLRDLAEITRRCCVAETCSIVRGSLSDARWTSTVGGTSNPTGNCKRIVKFIIPQDTLRTRIFEETLRRNVGSYSFQCIHLLWDSLKGIHTFMTFRYGMNSTTTYHNYGCLTLPVPPSQGYLLSNESIQSCADVVQYCGSLTKMPEFSVDGGNAVDPIA